jgi:hypothetical protein
VVEPDEVELLQLVEDDAVLALRARELRIGVRGVESA